MIMKQLLDSTRKIDRSVEVSQQISEKVDALLQVARRVDFPTTTVATVDREEDNQTWKLLGAVLRNPASVFSASQSSSNTKRPLNGPSTLLDLFDVPPDRENILRGKVAKKVIRSLAYPAMNHRFEALTGAYPETFKWALDGTHQLQPDTMSLSQWLKSGKGVYWISGKAGSGKSTLMKYILDSEVTLQCLETWESNRPPHAEDTLGELGEKKIPLCLATFFFWNSGQVDQKSQKGMLRSLLFQIFSKYHDIIPIVCDYYWATAYKRLLENEDDTVIPVWDLSRLISTLQDVFRQTTIPIRVCLLIDGLDEFEAEPGDSAEPEDIAKLFKDITSSGNVKACVSSRPWPIFATAYQSYPFLRLQDLNGPDIIKYVDGKFGQSNDYQALLLREPSTAPQLIEQIIDKSQGVFLWVRIVVQNILRGITNGDDISESLRRLRAIPPELEPLYHHLLNLIEKADNMFWASKAFQIIRAMRDFCSDNAAGPIRRTKGNTPLYILILQFALEGRTKSYTNLLEHRNLTPGTLAKACESPKVRITARCAGFLEVPSFGKDGSWSQIEYLHRTSRDFLEQKDVWSRLLRSTIQSNFNPNRALLQAQILWLTICIRNPGYEHLGSEQRMNDIVQQAMLHSYYTAEDVEKGDDVEEDSSRYAIPSTESLLDELDSLMCSSSRNHNRKPIHWTYEFSHDIYSTPLELRPGLEFAGYTALFGNTIYVESKITDAFDSQTTELDQAKFIKVAASSILYSLLRYTQYAPGIDTTIPLANPKTVTALLNLGADPNYAAGNTYIDASKYWPLTTWQNVLDFAANHYDAENMAASELHSARFTESFVEIVGHLITAGAWYDVDENGMAPELWGWGSTDELVKGCIVPNVSKKAGKKLLVIIRGTPS